MKATAKVCIFIPAYNCERTVARVIDDIPSGIRKNATILVIDDGSADNTSDAVLQYKKQHTMSNLILKKNPHNLGYGGTQKVAYRYAIDNGYAIVFMVHGDKQHPGNEKIIEALSLMDGTCALVYGSRMLGNPRKGGMPFYKLIGSKVLTAIENLVLGTKLTEFHSGFRAYSCAHLKQINFEKLTDRYFFDTEILIQIVQKKFVIKEIPIPTYYGPDSGYGIPFTESVKYSLSILKTLLEYTLSSRGLVKSRKFATEV
ncbi:MAG: glycosyltransferase family 2 protein [Candidatus Aenigmarchaeota archaeon]|nr:glycosyltransferase family 2 protein [Candidatus Aenigmarchaeota archaeon]